jgi:hypothetical protein
VNARSLATLLGRDARSARGAFATSGFGILAGTAALFFFLSLGLGVRAVLLGAVFPIDKIELEPEARADPGLLALLLGPATPPGISPEAAREIERFPGVVRVYPKLRFAFPCTARGGAEIFGHDVGTSEMLGDGVDPALVAADVRAPWTFADPWESATVLCTGDDQCGPPRTCERPSGEPSGRCVEPVPALVSRYLVEVFNKGIAPAHGLPAAGESLIARAQGITFQVRLGESLLGKSRAGTPRTVRARIVGVSTRSIDLGVTLPIGTVRRWNAELAGEQAARSYSSLLVETESAGAVGEVLSRAAKLGLVPRDTRARDVSVLVSGVMALLGLVATVILALAASNIAYTFRVMLHERRAEIGLYRAVGATRSAIRAWILCLAALVGSACAVAGAVVGRAGAALADWFAARRLPDFPFKPDSFFACPWWLVVATVVSGVLFALAGAVGPAIRAARVDPREALSNGA